MTEVHGRKRVEVTTAALTTIGVILAVFALLMTALSNSARAGEALPADTQATPGPSDTPSPTPEPSTSGTTSGSTSDIKNVVLLLADDLDWTAFNQVPRLAALKDAGTTLTNFVVTDSLCCPSRTSLMRSQFVHNHRVISNVPPTGGWSKFYMRKLQNDCLPTWLQAAGVNTSLIGKYLNGFPMDAPTES